MDNEVKRKGLRYPPVSEPSVLGGANLSLFSIAGLNNKDKDDMCLLPL